MKAWNYTYSINWARSSLTSELATCITANAAYPGSCTCLIFKTSLSTVSNLALNSYPSGSFKYGGSGVPLARAPDRRANVEVKACVVGETLLTSRAKSSNQVELSSFLFVLGLLWRRPKDAEA